MSHLPKTHSSPPQNDQFPSQQTLDNPNTILEDDDLVNVDDGGLPYTFVIDPFSPLDSSFYVPAASCYNRQVNSDSCSCCSSEPELESDCADSTVYPDCLYGRDEEYDQMDFVTDLFDSRVEIGNVCDAGITDSEATVINNQNHNQDDDFVLNNAENLGLGLGLGNERGGGGGLRVARIESESDTEDLGPDHDQNNDRMIRNESNYSNSDRPSLDTTSTRIEEISVSSDISSEGDAAVGVLEWEILLAVNNSERDIDDGGEGFVYTPEFDTLIGQFVDTVRALRGSPPAAKSFIDNLPLVALNSGDYKGDDEVIKCAVCKDEFLMEERVARLPCTHHYHGECIVPWLSVRNTCPVCRFELPTDDFDYERSKNRADDDELRVGYGFDVSH